MIRPTSHERAASRPGAGASGFSLIELMFTVALAGILMTVAAPSLTKMIKTNRVQTEASSFVGDLMVARTEAVKRGVNVSACVSSDGATCLTTNTWHSGWIVFADPTSACSGTTSAYPAVRVRKAFSSSDTFAASTAKSCITFNREGFTSNLGTATVTFTIHTSDTLAGATRCVAVDLGGHLTTQTSGQASCS